jgi:hypothetical protein
MDFFKTVTGKVVGGLVSLMVVIAGISWWRMDQHTRATLISDTGRIASWLGFVLLFPCATFFIIAWAAKWNHNAAGAILVTTYTLMESLLLGYLFHWSLGSTSAWTFFLVGVLLSAVYNLLICDWLAEKME